MDGKAVWAATGTVVRKYLRGKEVCSLSRPVITSVSHRMKGLDGFESVRGTSDILAHLWLTTPGFV